MDMEEFLSTDLYGITVSNLLIILIKAFIVYAVVQLSVWVVKVLFRQSARKQRRAIFDRTALTIVQRIVVYAIYILGGAVMLSLIPGLEKMGNSILAGAGIMTMAVGFASQEALSNIVSGLFIAFAKPFRLGDSIILDSTIRGTVVEITLRHTVLNNPENRKIIIPNSKINSATIINSTIGEPATCSFIEVGVAYTTNLDHAIAVMREEIMKHPLLIDRRSQEDKNQNVPQVVIRVTELGESAITLKAWAWAAGSGDAFILKCDLLKSIKERFDAEKIEIPYPYLNTIIKNEHVAGV